LSSQYRLTVNINDENDCKPKFTQLNYQFRLSNSSPIGYFIGQVQANDDDYSPNFRFIQYRFLENTYQNLVNINPNNGSLFLTKQSSIGMNFSITVLAIDQHNQSLYDRANIEILLFDQRTCLPSFSQTIYVFNTTEHQKIPYEIGKVTTDDCLRISYDLIIENSSSSFPFSLDSHTGIITVIHELDREIKSFYKFYINSTIRTEIQINILDKNDHYPIFDNSNEQYIYISRHHQQNNNIFITQIHATDDDIDSNGLVNYYFTNKDHYAYFHLYSNGSIILYNQENIHLPVRLEISACDQGYPRQLNSKESIVIYVCDRYERNGCLSNEISNRLRRNFYLGSIFIMISVVLFLLIIIICIIWKLFIKKEIRNKKLHQGRMEARKNLSKEILNKIFFLICFFLVVSDSLDDNHHLKAVVV
jgi:hypothetical protein